MTNPNDNDRPPRRPPRPQGLTEEERLRLASEALTNRLRWVGEQNERLRRRSRDLVERTRRLIDRWEALELRRVHFNRPTTRPNGEE